MGFSLIYVCFVTHILSLNPWTFFILIGCCTYYDNLSIEKGFQGGGDRLRKEGYRLESLAIVESMEPGHIVFR